jgi:hypothetical protein
VENIELNIELKQRKLFRYRQPVAFVIAASDFRIRNGLRLVTWSS